MERFCPSIPALTRNPSFWLFIFGVAFALIFSWGLPLWDDDYNWIARIEDQSVPEILGEILSPVSTLSENWGFNDRPVQSLVTWVLYRVWGYNALPFYLYKSFIFGLLLVVTYRWALLVTRRRRIATLCAVFYGVTPAVMAAHLWIADFATTAELVLAVTAWLCFHKLEGELFSDDDLSVDVRPWWRWFAGWLPLLLLIYLAYKTKADTKILPFILLGHVLLVAPRRFLRYLPLGLIVILLAVPWGPAVFHRLPPWLPGSGGSEISWMFREATFHQVLDFIGDPRRLAPGGHLFTDIPFSILETVGPLFWLFLLLLLMAALRRTKGTARTDDEPDRRPIARIWRLCGLRLADGPPVTARARRAMVFVLVWSVGALAVSSMLPDMQHLFRIRYGIIPLLPACILLGGMAGRLIPAAGRGAPALGRWLAAGLLTAGMLQIALNGHRAGHYRQDFGGALAVHRAYSFIRQHSPWPDTERLLLGPGFQPYAYPAAFGELFRRKIELAAWADLLRQPPGRCLVLAWQLELRPDLQVLKTFTGISDQYLPALLFDNPHRVLLYRYVGLPEQVPAALHMLEETEWAQASALLEDGLDQYPDNPGLLDFIGKVSHQRGDYRRMAQVYGRLHAFAPLDRQVSFNLAVARYRQGDMAGAIPLLEQVQSGFPDDAEVLRMLVQAYTATGHPEQAAHMAAHLDQLSATTPSE